MTAPHMPEFGGGGGGGGGVRGFEKTCALVYTPIPYENNNNCGRQKRKQKTFISLK